MFTAPDGAGTTPAPVPAALTLGRSGPPGTVSWHAPLALRGRLGDSAGAGIPGAAVLLRCPGLQAAANTDAGGGYALVVHPVASGSCQATSEGLQSAPLRVAVTWSSRVTALRPAGVAGRVVPAHAGVGVLVIEGSRVLGRARTDGAGRWGITLRVPLGRGRHRLTVVVTGSRGLGTARTVAAFRVR